MRRGSRYTDNFGTSENGTHKYIHWINFLTEQKTFQNDFRTILTFFPMEDNWFNPGYFLQIKDHKDAQK